MIGVPLPTDGLRGRRSRPPRRALDPDGDEAFNEAILTTDAFAKRATLEVELPSGTVRLSAQAKGAGMIEPAFATMLCFVQTDAALAPETAELLLGVCVKRSFDRISVDGQLSTNDTVILQCSGASGVAVAPESEDELRFGEALDALLRMLALMIVRDGEGAKRIGRIARARRRAGGRRALRAGDRQLAAREDRAARRRPELGPDRPGARAGAAGRPRRWRSTSRSRAIAVCAGGAAVAHDEAALQAAAAGLEIEYEVRLGPPAPTAPRARSSSPTSATST